MEPTTGGSKGDSSVESIKVEPDFYFPAAAMVIDDDFDDEDDDDPEGGQLQMHQIDLYDSPASTKTHTGEKPYRCELCQKDFTQSCNLHSHYRRNHGVDPKVTPRLFDQMRQQAAAASSPNAASTSQWPSQPAVTVRAMPKLIPKPTGQPFQCCVCDEPFFDRDLLLIHEETHAPEAPFECRYCTTMFSGIANLRSHVNVHKASLRSQPPQTLHPIRQSTAGIRVFAGGPVARKLDPPSDASGSNAVLNSNQPFVASGDEKRPYKCVECKVNFEKQELYFHMRAHLKQKNIFSKKSLKCDKCEKVFEKELTLRKHMETAHPVVVSSVSSGDGSFLLEALKTDARSLSPAATKSGKVQISSEVEVQEADDVIEIKQEPESALGDDQVNSTVSDNPILTQLLNTNSNEQQPAQQQHSRNGTPVGSVPPPGDNDVSNEGGFVISAVATVDHNFLERLERMEQRQKQEQMELETQQQPVSSVRRMPVLEESLRRPPVMMASNKSPAAAPNIPQVIHTGPFRCSFCLKEFNEHFGLRQHLRAMHYSEKRHKCKECNKKFSLGISLAIHRRVHTSVRPFTCIVCYKTFPRSTALNGHLSSHSYGVVKCAECGEEQLSVFNYMKHIEKFHPNFMQNVASYREQAESLMQRRRQIILEITQGLAEHRSEIPNVLARLRGELNSRSSAEPKKFDDEDEVSSSEQVTIKRRRPDSFSQSEEVSSASEEHEARRSLKRESLPALRAELRKRPLRSNTGPDELHESAVVMRPVRNSARPSSGNSSPNLKRLLEQNSPFASSAENSREATEQGIPPAVTVKDEPSN